MPQADGFLGNFANNFVTGAVSQAIINKGKVNFAGVAADAFGNAIGNAITGRIASSGQQQGEALRQDVQEVNDSQTPNDAQASKLPSNYFNLYAGNDGYATQLTDAPLTPYTTDKSYKDVLTLSQDAGLDEPRINGLTLEQSEIEIIALRKTLEYQNQGRIEAAISRGESLSPTIENANRLGLVDINAAQYGIDSNYESPFSSKRDLAKVLDFITIDALSNAADGLKSDLVNNAATGPYSPFRDAAYALSYAFVDTFFPTTVLDVIPGGKGLGKAGDLARAEGTLAKRELREGEIVAKAGTKLTRFEIKSFEEYTTIVKGDLGKNAVYSYRGLEFETDGLGRAISSRGFVDTSKVGERLPSLDKAIGKADGALLTDVGFHAGADRLGFPGGKLNVFPGNGVPDPIKFPGLKNLNQSAYSKLESQLAQASKDNKVYADFRREFNPGNTTQRPDIIVVQYKVGDGDIITRRFKNQPGG